MGNSFRTKTLAAAVSLAIASGGLALTAQAAGDNPAAKTRASTDVNASAGAVYILTFVEDGLVAYKGGVSGLHATAPSALGQRKLDANSAAATAYKEFLAAQRDSYLATIQGALGRALEVTHSYAVTQNGVAAEMSAAEAARIAQLPGVKSVRPAGVEHLVTYRGPAFIGADTIWDGSNTPDNVGTRGEGIVVGVLDGGTNSDHPSFANDASCGFDGANPKLDAADCSASTAGVCNGANPEANPGFGHGVHTSSTVAGNTIDNTATPPPSLPDGTTMSGVAPCAAIKLYKVCQTNSCGGADIVAGIENATTDGVDVLNFSISGGASPWTDNDRLFLDAVEGDVFVSASAGNNTQADPTVIGRVNHRGPWVMTVAASTQDQIIGPSMSIVGPGSPPAEIQDIPLNPGSTTPASSTPTYSGEPAKSYPTNIEGCTASGGIPAGTFTDSIAVIRRGTCTFTEKITNAFNAGAEMVVIANNQPGSISMDTTGAPVVPAFSIGSQATGDALIAFLASNPADSTADVSPVDIAITQGDVLADFSYRGPTPGPLTDLTKPDITGPGVNIYAALDDLSGDYGFMSGTSMSSPHVAGAAALVRDVRPDWSVTEVKSAMMMTATGGAGTQEDGVTPWNIDDVGSGRVDLTKAALAGLTMDETIANFLAANPSGGSVSVRDLNIPALRNLACSPDCTWTRTVKNQLDVQGTWNVTSDTGATFTVTASPDNFTLAPDATQEITFTAAPIGAVTEIAFGNVVLSEAGGLAPAQHITVAIEGEGAVDDVIFADGFDGAGGGGDVVDSGVLNAGVPDSFDGMYVNWLDVDTSCTAECNWNPYNDNSGLTFYWPANAAGEGGVSLDGTSYAILGSGDTVGPDSQIIAATSAGDYTNWRAGADGFLGFKFVCPAAGGFCYGYAHLTTTAPNGFPATLVQYWYNSAGEAITIP